MSVQTTYGITPAVAYPGMLAEQFSERQVDSFLAENNIVAGRAVMRGTDPTAQVLQLSTSVDNLYGVAVAAIQDNEVAEGGSITYNAEASVPVMYRGRIWVLSSAAVAVDDQVVPGLDGNSGKWVAGTSGSKIKAVARTATGGADELLLIELSGPQVLPAA